MDNYLKGADYERQIRDHLLAQPDIIDAWLWRDIPESVLEQAGILYDFEKTRKQRKKAWDEGEHCLPDTGTDILAVKKEQLHTLYQAKNYNGTVQQADLAGFYRMQLIFDLPGEIWFPNKVSRVVADMPPGYTKTKLVKFDYKETPASITDQVADTSAPKYILRDYQLEAVAAIKDQLTTARRTVLAMACGSGKTLVSATVAAEYDNVVVLSPLQAIAEQNFDRFGEVLPHARLLVDSEGERDVKTLVKFVKSNKKWVLSATFKSVDVIWEALKKSKKLEHTFFVVDEFHGLSKPDILDPEKPMNKLLESNALGLMVSATPRVYEVSQENVTDKINKYFGETAYKIPLSQAIQRKLVTDYRVFFPLIGEEGQEKEVYSEVAGIQDASELMLAKAMFLLRGMLDQGSRKAIAYFASHAAVEAFYGVLTKVAVDYFGLGDFWSSAILSGDNKVTRKARLDKFGTHQGIAVMCNALILSEAIDIQECDTIFMGDPCRSRVRNVQRVCRANRLDPEHPNKVAKIFVWADQEDDLLEFVSSIKEVDPDFCQKLSVLSRRYERTTPEKKEQLKMATESTAQLCIKIKEYIGYAQSKEQLVYELVAWVKLQDRLPLQQATDQTEKKLGLWLNNYRRAIEGKNSVKVDKQVNIILDKNIPLWRDPRLMQALAIAKSCKEWVEANNKLPSSNAQKPEAEKQLGMWLCTQRNIALCGSRTEMGCCLRQEVLDFLDTNIPGWKSPSLFLSLNRASELVKWTNQHERFPQRKKAKDEQEKSCRIYLDNLRAYVRDGSDKAHIEVIAFLDEHLSGWQNARLVGL